MEAAVKPAARLTEPGVRGRRPHVREAVAARQSVHGATLRSVTVLLLVVALSMADSLVSDTVPYERDTVVYYYPLLQWIADQLRHGQFPLWSPAIFGGYPIFADGEMGLAYPPMLAAMLTLPPDRAFVALRFLHVALAAVGAYALARAWRLPHVPSVLAGLTFSLGSFFDAQIHHENIIRTAAWLPWALACAEMALRSRGTRLHWTVLAGVAVGTAALSLHTQILVIDLLTLAAYGLLRWWSGPFDGARGVRARALGVAAVFPLLAVLGIGLGAVQLLPLGELAQFSPRGAGVPYSDSAAYSLTVPGFIQLLLPLFFRGPAQFQWGLWTHWESYLYVGLAPTVLALVALVRIRFRAVAVWAVLGGLFLVIALGQYSPVNLHYLLWLLPGVGGLRAPGRFTLTVTLAVAMLAAYGLAALQGTASVPLRKAAPRWLTWATLATPFGLAALLGLVNIGMALAPQVARTAIERLYLSQPRDAGTLSATNVYNGLGWSTAILQNPRTIGGLLGLLAVCGGLWAWRRAPSPRLRHWPGWPTAFVTAAAVDLLIFAWSIHPREPLGRISAEQPAIQAIAASATAGPNSNQPYRVLASSILNQVASDRLAAFGMQDAGGYSSLESRAHSSYLQRVQSVDDGLLDLWNVRFLVEPASFGSLPTYRGVTFLPPNALLRAPGGSSLGDEAFAAERSIPLTEIRWVTALVDGIAVPQDTPVAEVTLRGSDGALLDQRLLLAGRDVMEWSSNDPQVRPLLQHQRVEAAGSAYETVADGSRKARVLSFTSIPVDDRRPVSSLEIRVIAPQGQLAVYGAGLVGADGTLQQLFGWHQAKYSEVYRDAQLAVYENHAVLPRALVLGSALVASSPGTALSLMTAQPFDPRSEVVLACVVLLSVCCSTASGPVGTAEVVDYQANAVSLRTTSAQAGYLVLTDTYFPGWRAYVDGRETPIYRADSMFRAIELPSGSHDVQFQFQPSSIQVGLWISVAAGVVCLALLCLPAVLRRRLAQSQP